MQNMHRMRQLLEIVDQLNKNWTSDDVIANFGIQIGIERRDCIRKFLEAYPKYTRSLAEELCDSAIAHGFISGEAGIMIHSDERRLSVAPLRGRQLLSKSGYINEMAGTVGKLPPILTLFIALSALLVSILVAVFK